MDKSTLSNYGWIVIAVLVLAVMIALATPFGSYIKTGVENTTQGLFDTSEKALNVVGMSAGDGTFGPKMLEGDGQVLNKNESVAFFFRSSAPVDTFKEVKVDGETVASENYTVTEGSTIVTFTEQYALTLADGNHTVEIVSDDGYGEKSATANFSIGNFLPEGATYTINSTKQVLQAGDEFPGINSGDIYTYGDYKYTYSNESPYGWKVGINTSVTDKKQTSYGAILENINGEPVTSMYSTFAGCTSLRTAPAIPNGVTDMRSTFNNCTSLTTAPAIPSSVTNMNSTFSYCTSLTTAPAIPNSVTNMTYTFNRCTSLRTAPAIPSSVTDMTYTFSYCTSLTDLSGLVIPNSVTNMTYTFYWCTNLKLPPAIPNSVTNMEHTFDRCSYLTAAPAIPSSVTNMNGTFIYCESLFAPPEIPNGVTDMKSTFSYCTSLFFAPAIPNSVTNMTYTFNGCTSLTGTVLIPCTATTNSTTVPSGVTLETYHYDGCGH